MHWPAFDHVVRHQPQPSPTAVVQAIVEQENKSWHKAPSNGSTPRRASASSPPTAAAPTSSSTTRRSRPVATARWRKTKRSATPSPKATKVPRPPPSPLSELLCLSRHPSTNHEEEPGRNCRRR